MGGGVMTLKDMQKILTSKAFNKALHSMSMDKLRAIHKALLRSKVIQANRSKVMGKRL